MARSSILFAEVRNGRSFPAIVSAEKTFPRQSFYVGYIQGVGKEKRSVVGKGKKLHHWEQATQAQEEVKTYHTYGHLYNYCCTYRSVEDKKITD